MFVLPPLIEVARQFPGGVGEGENKAYGRVGGCQIMNLYNKPGEYFHVWAFGICRPIECSFGGSPSLTEDILFLPCWRCSQAGVIRS